ncbi:nucleotidyltransferase, partial [Nonomuraea sp. NPDC055795]
MIRLMRCGLHLVRHGDLEIGAGPERERLLAVKRGEVSWQEVAAWRAALAAELESAVSVLPAAPDRVAVEEFLLDVRKAHL